MRLPLPLGLLLALPAWSGPVSPLPRSLLPGSPQEANFKQQLTQVEDFRGEQVVAVSFYGREGKVLLGAIASYGLRSRTCTLWKHVRYEEPEHGGKGPYVGYANVQLDLDQRSPIDCAAVGFRPPPPPKVAPAPKPAPAERRLSGIPGLVAPGDCQAFAARNYVTCASAECRAWLQRNEALCQTDDCRGFVLHNENYCRSKDCYAIVFDNWNYCEGADCKAWLYKNENLCKTAQCRAVMQRNPGLCPR